MLCDSEIGAHLVTTMLEPTRAARERLGELEDKGRWIWAPPASKSKVKSVTFT